MSRNLRALFSVHLLIVLTSLVQAAPVDVDGDGRVGPQEMFDLLLGWSGQALPAGVAQPWQLNGTALFYNGGQVGIGTNAPVLTTLLNVVTRNLGSWAIRGDAPSGGIGVAGVATGGINARGVYGAVGPGGYCGTSGDHSGSGAYGLLGTANEGLFAFAPNGNGVRGVANTGIGAWGSSDTNAGVYGESNSNNGVSGVTSGTANGVYGQSGSGSGVFGSSNLGVGVKGASVSSSGVSGNSTSSIGVEGRSDSGHGVSGLSFAGTGVYGRSEKNGGGVGVWGSANTGVFGQGDYVGVSAEVPASGYAAIFADRPSGSAALAGFFGGPVTVIGGVNQKSSSVIMDHPLDPESKYLEHSVVDSPEMMNIYNGNVLTDSTGYAVVFLPGYFSALNRSFRYQLTIIDEADSDDFVQAKIVREIHDNRFTIRSSQPNTKVSWQVTGVRQDVYAKAHPLEVEKVKPEGERGKYLSPELYGQPAEKGVHFRPELQRRSETVLRNDSSRQVSK